MKSWMSLKMGLVGLKTRSRGQIFENPREPSGGHIFNLVFMKLGHDVCLDDISDGFENGSCSVKNQVTRSNHRRTYVCLQVRGCDLNPGLLFNPLPDDKF